jgi:hypothetical protein
MDHTEQELHEDVMAFVMRSGTGTSELGQDPSLPPVVEVGQVWGETLMDVKHLGPEDRRLTLGDDTRKPRPVGAWVGIAPVVLGIGGGLVVSSPILASMGAAASMVTLPGGLLLDELRRRGGEHTLFAPADDLPSPSFPLVERVGSAVQVNFTGACRGFLEEDGQRTSLRDLVLARRAFEADDGYTCTLPEGGRFVLDFGHAIYFVQQVPQGKRVVPGLTAGINFFYLGILLLVGFFGLALSVVVASTPYDASQEIVRVPDRIADITWIEPPPPPPVKKVISGDPDAGEGAKAKDEEGKVGRQDAKLDKARGTKVAMAASQLNKQIAEEAGLLAELSTMEANDNLFGTGGLRMGQSAFVGGVIGSQYGNQYGSGGLGSRGASLGGGGDGEYLGGLGTRGDGPGGSGWGKEGGWHGVKSTGTPSMSTQDPIILGALDKAVIDRVIKAHLSQFRYCYQKELNRNPDLQGKITMKFVIARDGSVSSAKVDGSSMDNAIVENCLCERFARLQFPTPKNGIVIVKYPFVFNSR